MGFRNRSAEELTSSLRTTEAMARYATGEAGALSEVYDSLAPKLRRHFLRQTRDHALTDDLVQQTFLNIHCARATFRPSADVVPWAFAIGQRLLIDEVRRRRHRGPTMELPSGDRQHGCASEPSEEATPEGIVASQQLAQRLDDELARLPDGQRTAFELVRLDGLSMAEAADVLGTTINAIKLRAHRAYDAMRAVLETDGARLGAG